MALYEAIITSVPVLLATLAFGPLRLFGLLPHRTARRHRRTDIVTDRQTIQLLAVVYLFAVAALTLELQHIGWRVAAGLGLCLCAGLVFLSVWVHARNTYDRTTPSRDGRPEH